MKIFDVALIGCGGVSAMHLDGYRAHPERVRIVAVCDPDEARREQTRRKYGVASAFASVEQMIEGVAWEAAVVCTPTLVRRQVVETLAAAGKHIFVEKPLADSIGEARQMVERCQAGGVGLAVNQNFRYHYPFHIARRLISEGCLGPVVSIIHQDLFFRQDAGWRTAQARHALSVMGVHWLDGFRRMLGCEARSLVCHTRSSPAIECGGETDAAVQIVFANGTVTSYVQSFSTPLARTETLVLGEKGLLVLSYGGVAFHEPGAGPEAQERWTNPYAGGGKPESAFAGLDHLLAWMEGGAEPPNSGRDNLLTVTLLEAAYRSAAEQRMIELEDGALP